MMSFVKTPLKKSTLFARFVRNYTDINVPGETTFALIKPDGMNHLGDIFDIVHEEGFYIKELRMSKFNKAKAKVFYSDHFDKDYYPPFADFICSGPIIGMNLARIDAIRHWKKVTGPRSLEKAKVEFPESIRARFAQSDRVNTVHGADSEKNYVRESTLFFSDDTLMTKMPPVYPNTILMLTPSILQGGKLGKIMREISESGCRINAMQNFSIEDLNEMERILGQKEANKVIRKKISGGYTMLLDISHEDGYDILLEEMLRIENTYDTGFSHFDRGEEKLSDKVFL